MKKIILAISIFISIFISILGYSQNRITIDECYKMAERNYPEIKRYGLLEKSEAYNISNASKSWLPQISLNGRASYQSDVTTIPLNELSEIIPEINFQELSKDQYLIQAEINQKVWDGGRTKAHKDIISKESEVASREIDINMYTLKERVNQIYFGVLLQKNILAQNRILKRELNNNLDMINAMIENGVSSTSDRQLLEVEILQLEQRTVNIKSSISSYLRILSYMTGKIIENNTLLEEPSMIDMIYNNDLSRPELKYYEAQKELLKSQEKMLNRDLMPNLNLFARGGYGRPALDMLDNSFKPFIVGGVQISWNIGKYYTNKNNKNLIDSKIANIELNKDIFLYNIELEKINQNEDIERQRKLIESDKKVYELRHSIKVATQAKVKNGIASTTDLINDINKESMAEMQLSTRQIELLSQIYNYAHTINSKK